MRGGWRRLGAVAGLALVALPAAGAAGCSDGGCDPDCSPPAAPPLELTATVVSEDDGVVRVRADDGNELDVFVTSGSSHLDVGDRYLFPLHGSEVEGGLPTAALGDCTCGAQIRNADGSEVDTGALPSVRMRGIAAVTFGAALAVVVLWGAIRHVRGEPL